MGGPIHLDCRPDFAYNIMYIPGSSNGRTRAFGARYRGSNPRPGARFICPLASDELLLTHRRMQAPALTRMYPSPIMAQMRNPFSGIRAVLFDMDGTLVETNIDFPLMRREMVALGTRYGIPESDMQGRDILGVVDLVVESLTKRGEEPEALKARQEAFEKLEQIELVHSDDAHEIPCAHELLEALRNGGMKVGIITRNCRAAVNLSLERAHISADLVLTRDDVYRTKPHPGHVLRALEIFNVPPKEALVVGDHRMDIASGKAAGARTIGFLRPDRPEDSFDEVEPDLIVRSLKELLDLAERLYT